MNTSDVAAAAVAALGAVAAAAVPAFIAGRTARRIGRLERTTAIVRDQMANDNGTTVRDERHAQIMHRLDRFDRRQDKQARQLGYVLGRLRRHDDELHTITERERTL